MRVVVVVVVRRLLLQRWADVDAGRVLLGGRATVFVVYICVCMRVCV
jgi:hypothetical protein